MLSSCQLCCRSFIHKFKSSPLTACNKLTINIMSSSSSSTTSTPRTRPIVISGPSGGGKSTLLTKLMAEYPSNFAFSVSHTTRQPRAGETEGKDYYFIDRENFLEMISNKEFLEHAEFSGNMYGTSIKSVNDIQNSGKICILDVEINGVKSIKKAELQPTPTYVFIKPPNLDTLKSRLEGRGTETKESLQKRLDTAAEALDYASKSGSYDHIIVNDNLEEAYTKFREILKQDLHLLK